MPNPKQTKKVIKAWAVVHVKRGNIKYINDGFYSPEIYKNKNQLDPSKGYRIVPITIHYQLPSKKITR